MPLAAEAVQPSHHKWHLASRVHEYGEPGAWFGCARDSGWMLEPLPIDLTLTPFHVRDARQFGVTNGQLRRKELGTPYRGVRRTAGTQPEFEAQVAAYEARLSRGQVFSHRTAGRLWGFRLPRWSTTEPLHVTAVHPARAPRITGVVGHHAEDVEICMLGTHPVTSVGDTWRQLSTVLSVDELIVAGDGLLRRRSPQAEPTTVLRALARHGGQRGIRRLRAAFEQLRPGTDSARETVLRLLLIRAGLREPEVNGRISATGAAVQRFGDLVYRDRRVVVEYEGVHHAKARATYLSDIQRFEELASWTFVRVTKEHLAAPGPLIERVRAHL